jgi:hypothetical protein
LTDWEALLSISTRLMVAIGKLDWRNYNVEMERAEAL